jgi:hypothetical protein
MGKEYKKKTIVKHDLTKGLEILLQKYHNNIFLKVFEKETLERYQKRTNDDGIKYYDIYNTCSAKRELINEHDISKIKNTKKHKHIFKKWTPEPKKLKVK